MEAQQPVLWVDEDGESQVEGLHLDLQVAADPGADDFSALRGDGDEESFIFVAGLAI